VTGEGEVAAPLERETAEPGFRELGVAHLVVGIDAVRRRMERARCVLETMHDRSRMRGDCACDERMIEPACDAGADDGAAARDGVNLACLNEFAAQRVEDDFVHIALYWIIGFALFSIELGGKARHCRLVVAAIDNSGDAAANLY